MTICPKCGLEVKEDDEFCTHCGAYLASENKRSQEADTRVRETCFGEGGHGRDYFGLISFGLFLLIVGIVFVANPRIIADFRLWIEQMIHMQVFTRPPSALITSATLFFSLIGLSNFFVAGIRLIFRKVWRRGLSDVLSGVALILFAYFLHLYGIYVLTWQIVLAAEAVTVGFLIIMYSVVQYVVRKS